MHLYQALCKSQADAQAALRSIQRSVDLGEHLCRVRRCWTRPAAPSASRRCSNVQGPDIGVVVLQNSDSSGDHDDPESIARKLTAAALGEPYPAATAIAMGVAALKQVEGVYRIDAESNGEPPGTVVARTQHPLPTARQEVLLRRQELD